MNLNPTLAVTPRETRSLTRRIFKLARGLGGDSDSESDSD